jgi:hypothetical protein
MLAHILRAVPKVAVSYADISLIQSGGAVEGGASNITLSGVQTDDIIFLLVAHFSTTLTAPTGYTLYDSGVLSGSFNWKIYYKVMGSTPDTSVGITDSNADATAYVFYVFRNVNTTTPIHQFAKATGTTNPPSVTTDRKSMILVGGFGGGSAGSNFTAAPTGYSNFNTQDATANNDSNVAGATKVLTAAATEDPGAWTGSFSWSGQLGATIALNPKTI